MLVMEAIDVFDKINGFLLLWEFVGRVFFALNGIIDDICSNCLFTLNTCSGFLKDMDGQQRGRFPVCPFLSLSESGKVPAKNRTLCLHCK